MNNFFEVKLGTVFTNKLTKSKFLCSSEQSDRRKLSNHFTKIYKMTNISRDHFRYYMLSLDKVKGKIVLQV